MYNVGLPSGKVLYQLQAERILRLQELVRAQFQAKIDRKEFDGKFTPRIMWYVMTSEATDELTEAYFRDHSYFGLKPEQVRFFEQGVLPCYDFEGKVIMESRSRLAMAPDGNGGLYKALHRNGILDHMETNGVKYLHVYGVDNILVRVADPAFVGYCVEKKADAANKVVEKTDPQEPVGVVCWCEEAAYVVEYSELPAKFAELRDEDGRLTFRAGNIANHFFTTQFLRRVSQECEQQLVHHVAKKKIPYFGTKDDVHSTITPTVPNGIKMEKFVFDVFQFAKNFFVYEVKRDVEFSPLKNASGQDSPVTCRRDLFNLHRKWLEANGAKISIDQGIKDEDSAVEVSTLLAYYPESLKSLVDGKQLRVPIYLKAEGEKCAKSTSSTSENGSSDNAEREILDTSEKDESRK
jgi:UDP-N-acetylglucosamine/UDP-N-acetylgalactosamine diphosphorylase